jgi:hypothetical protein
MEEPKIIAKLKELGFAEIQTGGGCTAMWLSTPTGSILVTHDGGSDSPDDDDELLYVGEYGEDESEALKLQSLSPADSIKYLKELK